jgi:hypothetical protein
MNTTCYFRKNYKKFSIKSENKLLILTYTSSVQKHRKRGQERFKLGKSLSKHDKITITGQEIRKVYVQNKEESQMSSCLLPSMPEEIRKTEEMQHHHEDFLLKLSICKNTGQRHRKQSENP